MFFLFSLIAAKEVLSDKEMRQKFDQGEDPLDAEEERERQRHGNPFQGFHRQGGNPFGGGHQQFKFHFNCYSFFICYVLRSFGIHIITKHSWLVGLLVGFWCR